MNMKNAKKKGNPTFLSNFPSFFIEKSLLSHNVFIHSFIRVWVYFHFIKYLP